MQTLKIAENTIATTPGFMERQFGGLQTVTQRKWDWAFGVVLPTLCIAADPIVFRSSLDIGGKAWLGDYQTGAYALGFASTMGMAAWLLWGDRLGLLRPVLAGLFFTSSVVGLVTGLLMLPISLVGLVLVIGIFGFTPFLSSFIYLRNAVRAVRGTTKSMPTDYVWHAAVVAALYAVVIPIVLNFR